MSASLRILLVRAGQTEASVQNTHGDYTDWFEAVLQPLGVQCDHVAAFDGESLPDPADHDGVLVTGSPLSVRDEEPWMARLGDWTLAAAHTRPVLAVCFGHQVVGERLGGRVTGHVGGPEWGTVGVQLTADGRRDPLFDGLPDQLMVQGLHRDHIAVEPDPAHFVRLAGNAHTPLQSFAVGPNLRAVQFHPELRAATASHLLALRGWTPTSPVRESAHGRAILANWVAAYLGAG